MSLDELEDIGSAGAIAHSVLLVEDDPQTAQEYKKLLEGRGHSVVIARNGGQAMSSFVMHKPDFVLLDLILPGESGFELCERMKQSNETVPILVVSAIALEDARHLARRVGADGYLTKPIKPEHLFKTIYEVANEVWYRFHLGQHRDKSRVRFSCRCGKKFKVSTVHRGRTLTCPDCGETLVIPRHE